MKNKTLLIGIGIFILLVAILALSYSHGFLFQGALRLDSGINRAPTNQNSLQVTDQNYLIAPEEEEFAGCWGNGQPGTIVLSSQDTQQDFNDFAAELDQELDENNNYTRCHYRMYATKGNNVGDHTNQDRVRVQCRNKIEVKNGEIVCTRYSQVQTDTNYFKIRINPSKAIVETHSTYYSESINRVEHYNTWWIEQTEK